MWIEIEIDRSLVEKRFEKNAIHLNHRDCRPYKGVEVGSVGGDRGERGGGEREVGGPGGCTSERDTTDTAQHLHELKLCTHVVLDVDS